MIDRNLIIIPTYQESENISDLIEAIFRLELPFEVLIVDDNSSDGTAQIVKIKQEIYPERLHLMQRPKKMGLGTAYIDGFKYALEKDYDYIYEMDADFSHDPEDLIRLYVACKKEGYDLAIGSRYVKGVNVVNWPMGRILMSYCASIYVRLITGIPIFDTTAGFKCYHKSVLKTIDLEALRFLGYAFQIEMKFNTWKCGFKIKEVDVVFTDRRKGTSKMSSGIFKEAIFGVLEMKIRSLFKKYEPPYLSIESDSLDRLDTADDTNWNKKTQTYQQASE
ncbi:polyprenol monophosphomannose synthase [Cyclobacteriaceae bacterium]|jgi:dolichol-phosphate mannosyltransferase|nr:polyprenol monophosphomannose synthase [Cyclobacteriaceae bacterium]|tara:strand:- start:278 stop:1111 length:834 start_codon:yes stop_codon:yes gene_type:complete